MNSEGTSRPYLNEPDDMQNQTDDFPQNEARSYDPGTMIPQSPQEAKTFAEVFKNKRPPDGHPLSFDTMQIPVGLVLWTPTPEDKQIHRDPPSDFWERLQVPAALLALYPHISTASNVRQQRRSANSLLFNLEQQANLNENILLCLIKLPGSAKWNAFPVVVSDLYKTPEQLRREYLRLGKYPSDANEFRRRMKKVVYYSYTGVVIDE